MCIKYSNIAKQSVTFTAVQGVSSVQKNSLKKCNNIVYGGLTLNIGSATANSFLKVGTVDAIPTDDATNIAVFSTSDGDFYGMADVRSTGEIYLYTIKAFSNKNLRFVFVYNT